MIGALAIEPLLEAARMAGDAPAMAAVDSGVRPIIGAEDEEEALPGVAGVPEALLAPAVATAAAAAEEAATADAAVTHNGANAVSLRFLMRNLV